MKRVLNILLLVVSFIAVIPMLLPLALSGVALLLSWIAEKITIVFRYPIVFIEWLVVKINK